MRLLTILFLSVFFSLNCFAQTFKTEIKTVTINGDYAEIKESLEMAITDHGMVISKVFHISDMLERTGKAVGSIKAVYKKGEILSFCSASLSRKMMEENPEFISFCPFKISIYSLANDANQIQLTYQAIIASDAMVQKNIFFKINQLLASIVSEVIDS